MITNEYLKQWMRIVSYHLPHLSLPELKGLATWSFGMVMTRSSSLTSVSHFIAELQEEKVNTVRNRLKHWYTEANYKRRNIRHELVVNECFAPLLKWILTMNAPRLSAVSFSYRCYQYPLVTS